MKFRILRLSVLLAFYLFVLALMGAGYNPPADPVAKQNYDKGFTDAGGVVPPPTPEPPPIHYIASGTDLGPLVVNAKAGETIECEPNGTFTGIGTFGPSASNVTVKLNGGIWTLTTSKGSGTNISVTQPGFTITHGRLVGVSLKADGVTKDPLGSVVIRTMADDTTVDGVVFQKCGTAFQTSVADNWTPANPVGGTTANVINSKVEGSKKVGLYFDQSGFNLAGTYVGQADTEYAVRITLASKGPKATNCKITNVTINSAFAHSGKDALGIREGDVTIKGLVITGSTFRIGQENNQPVQPGDYCRIAMEWSSISGIPTTLNAVPISQGSMVRIANCSITAQECIVVGKTSVLDLADNTHYVPAGAKVKPLVAVSSQGKYTPVAEQNTKTIVQP